MEVFVSTNINSSLPQDKSQYEYKEDAPKSDQEVSDTETIVTVDIEEKVNDDSKVSTKDEHRKDKTGPQNDSDKKANDVGANQIQSPPPYTYHSLRDWDIVLFNPNQNKIKINLAKIFHEIYMDQSHYIEERIKSERDLKEELIENPPKEDIQHQLERIEIQRLDAA